MPSRRSFLATVGSAGIIGTAGCLGNRAVADLSASHRIEIPPGVEPDFAKRYLSPAELAVYVERGRERFGNRAPWGLRDQVRNEGEFVGAWQSTRAVETQTTQVATVETLCMTRRVTVGETPRLRHVLWAGATLNRARQPLVAGTGPRLAFDTMRLGLETGRGPTEIRAVAPRSSEKAIEDGVLTISTTAMAPLRRPAPDGDLTVQYTRTSPTGYTVAWQGTHRGPLALHAVCETTTPPEEKALRFAVTAGVSVDTLGVI